MLNKINVSDSFLMTITDSEQLAPVMTEQLVALFDKD
jgi:hypothetical protein